MSTTAERPISSEPAIELEKRSIFRRLLDFIFDFDFFISYAWNDGASYAAALARRLEADGFEVFLDRRRYAIGDDWKRVGTWTLRRTGQLILVGSPAAIHSNPVIREAEIFSATGRRIVPIDFAGSLEWTEPAPALARYLPLEILRIKESAEALKTGPSDETLASIRRTFDLVRQDKKRVRVFATIALLLFVLAIAATWFGYTAERQREASVANESRALAALARTANDKGLGLDGTELALAAWPRQSTNPDRPQLEVVLPELARSLALGTILVPHMTHDRKVKGAAFDKDARRILSWSYDRTSGASCRGLMTGRAAHPVVV